MVIYSFEYIRFLKLSENNINPLFIKMDKDRGQIWAAQKIWPKATISLCLWHVLRAVKRRLSEPKTVKNVDFLRYYLNYLYAEILFWTMI